MNVRTVHLLTAFFLFLAPMCRAQLKCGIVSTRGTLGEPVGTRVVVMPVELSPAALLLFIAVDSIRPDHVTILFSSSVLKDETEATLNNSYGHDIRLSAENNADGYDGITRKRVIGTAEISLEEFELFCNNTLIILSTGMHAFEIHDRGMEQLLQFRAYLNDHRYTAPIGHYSECDVEPSIMETREPHYPDIAVRAGLEGGVLVEALVNAAGKVEQVEVLKSDAEIFNTAAKDAAKQCSFTPGTSAGIPVSAWVQIPFRFRLNHADPAPAGIIAPPSH